MVGFVCVVELFELVMCGEGIWMVSGVDVLICVLYGGDVLVGEYQVGMFVIFQDWQEIVDYGV